MDARELAIRVLSRVRATDAYLNVVLDAHLAEHPLKDSRDAGLVTELCYGTTRRQLQIDFALSKFLDRGIEQIEDKVLAALRIGVYQLFFLRVPKHAAVSATIDALKALQLSRATGFVNAVLRKLAALEELPLPGLSEKAAHLSVRESHPQWLVERWLRQFGEKRTEAMLVANNQPAQVVVRVNTRKITRDELLATFQSMGIEARSTLMSPVGIVLPSVGKVEDVYGFAEGLWQVQDEAAQLVTVYAAVTDDARILDVCAAPGGKTCHMAQTGRVTSMDLHANKLRKIEAEAKRLGLSDRISMRAHDAQKALPEDLGEFDVVVVDAPCTGLGTLRRHPELRYRRQESDVGRLAQLQRNILENAQAAVAPGGLLVYAVCSVETQEGPDQIEMFLRSHPEFTAEPPVLPEELPLMQAYLRTLPGPEGLDGFFAARLRRMY